MRIEVVHIFLSLFSHSSPTLQFLRFSPASPQLLPSIPAKSLTSPSSFRTHRSANRPASLPAAADRSNISSSLRTGPCESWVEDLAAADRPNISGSLRADRSPGRPAGPAAQQLQTAQISRALFAQIILREDGSPGSRRPLKYLELASGRPL
jgi:hypothetical protein